MLEPEVSEESKSIFESRVEEEKEEVDHSILHDDRVVFGIEFGRSTEREESGRINEVESLPHVHRFPES